MKKTIPLLLLLLFWGINSLFSQQNENSIASHNTTNVRQGLQELTKLTGNGNIDKTKTVFKNQTPDVNIVSEKKKIDEVLTEFIDNRDNKTYKIIKIGSQIWMAENLAYKEARGCWAYNNEPSNVTTYGYLYTWETAKNSCPSGWHLPSDDEWEKLAKYIDFSSGSVSNDGYGSWLGMGELLKGKYDWNSEVKGLDNYGFYALPGGSRGDYGSFEGKGLLGKWWSSTSINSSSALCRSLHVNNNVLYRYSFGYKKNLGFSVRCIKD